MCHNWPEESIGHIGKYFKTCLLVSVNVCDMVIRKTIRKTKRYTRKTETVLSFAAPCAHLVKWLAAGFRTLKDMTEANKLMCPLMFKEKT